MEQNFNVQQEPKPQDLYGFKFVGSGGEFFNIWIANILLSIVTFGIYSPWAKVRNNKYLYGATQLDRIGFEYTANPIRILIGRLIVVGGYIAFIITQDVLHLPVVAGIMGIVFFLLFPWLVRQAIKFKMRYTRYRGIHFSNQASLWQFYKFFLFHGLLIVLTLGLIIPYTVKEFNSLVINNTYYGNEKFSFSSSASPFYVAYGKIYGLVILVFGSIGYYISTLGIDFKNKENIPTILGIFFIMYISILISSFLIKGYMKAWIGNAVNNNTQLGDFELKSFWSGGTLAWIYFSNFFMMSFTMGLLTPWAKVRVLKYLSENACIQADNFEGFINTADEQTRAFGEEAADFFDFDVGL